MDVLVVPMILGRIYHPPAGRGHCNRGARALQPRATSVTTSGPPAPPSWRPKSWGHQFPTLNSKGIPAGDVSPDPGWPAGAPFGRMTLPAPWALPGPVAELAGPKPVTTKKTMFRLQPCPLGPGVPSARRRVVASRAGLGTLRCRLAHDAPAPQIAADHQQRQITKLIKTSHLELKLHQST